MSPSGTRSRSDQISTNATEPGSGKASGASASSGAGPGVRTCTRIAGTATGVGNLCANIGGFATACVFGLVKDQAGTFTWGYRGIAVVCLAGVALSLVLVRGRSRALAAGSAVTLKPSY